LDAAGGGDGSVSVNTVNLVGNLTRDPELRATPSGTSVLDLGLAVNDRVKDQATGQWGDRPNFFDLSIFGKRADSLAGILSRGDKVAIAGRLRWHQWETPAGEKRSRVTVVVDELEFMQGRDRGAAAASGTPAGAPPMDDDDIPF
jgi:single-strand DNA-binding protein